jgi:C_GCAxxG_C_C family probable redox protein
MYNSNMKKKVNRAKAAAAVMKEHKMNCAQTVVTSFCEELGIERDLALKIAMGFGGGMGRTGRTCGAVTGAYIVLGLAQEISPENPREAINRTYALMKKFNRRFVNKHGSMTCKELLGIDTNTKKGLAEARRKEVFTTLCPNFVATSVKILEGMLKENSEVRR